MCLCLSAEPNTCSSPRTRMWGGLFLLEQCIILYSWPTTHKLGCSLCCPRVLGQPPVTIGKVTGPSLSSLVQRARKEEAAGPAGLRARKRKGTKSYQCTSQAMGYYQANGRAICHNWCRSLKETPLALPRRSQGLVGQTLFQLEVANLIKGWGNSGKRKPKEHARCSLWRSRLAQAGLSQLLISGHMVAY